MAHYVVTSRQLVSTTVAVALLVTAAVWFGLMYLTYQDLPEIFLDGDGKCLKVINYKNGDGYQCQDKDVLLRKYKIAK